MGSAPLYLTGDDGQVSQCVWHATVTSGPERGRRFPLHRGSLLVGAGPAAEVQLTDDSVSRFHAELEVHAAAVRIGDLDSTNGCWLEDRRVERAWVLPDATVRFGSTELRFERQLESIDQTDLTVPLDTDLVVASSSSRRAAVWTRILARDPRTGLLLWGPPGSGRSAWARALQRQLGPETSLFEHLEPGRLPASGVLSLAGDRIESSDVERLARRPPGLALVIRAERPLDRYLDPLDAALLAPISVELRASGERPEDLAAFATALLQRQGLGLGHDAARLIEDSSELGFSAVRSAVEDVSASGPSAALREAVLKDALAATRGDVDAVARCLGVSGRDLFGELSQRRVPLPD